MPNSPNETPLKVKLAQALRDSMHNYVIQEPNELEDEVFFTRLKRFIILLEGSRNEAYYDGIYPPRRKPEKPNRNQYISMAEFNSFSQEIQDKLRADAKKKRGRAPIVTVGIGLNIEPKNVRERYDGVFKQPGLMQDVYEGKKNLTDEQVSLILKRCLEERLGELRRLYGSTWDKLRANERMCIHSLYFNNPTLVGKHSNFKKCIQKYVETSDKTFLEQAVDEVIEHSNPNNDKGIENRRNAEGALLLSSDCPTYTKPALSPDDFTLGIVELGKTVVPQGIKGDFSRGINGDYFIWRTQMDGSVREAHLALEGKVFRKYDPLQPGGRCNCRCTAEDVPDWVNINHEASNCKAFGLYLRTGIQIYRETAALKA